MADVVGDQCYSKKHMKKRIIDYFGDSVIASSIDGKHDIISLRQNTTSIVHEFYEHSRGKTDGEKKQQIIDMAAKLIKGDINSLYHNKDLYPSFTDISSTDMNINFLSSSLRGFLRHIFPNNS